MSGQTIADVIGHTIRPFLKAPTLTEQLNTYVAQLAQRWPVHGAMPDQESVPLPTSVPLRQLIRSRVEDIANYCVATAQFSTPTTFDQDDDTVLSIEITEFKAYLAEHQYSSDLDPPRNEEQDPDLIRSHEQDLWERSRVSRGVGVVSFGVWYQMQAIAHSMVTHTTETRVSLTQEEERAAVADALAKKRAHEARVQEQDLGLFDLLGNHLGY